MHLELIARTWRNTFLLDTPSNHQNVLRKANLASLLPHRRRPVEPSQPTEMGSRLLARSAAARFLSHLRRRTPDPTHRLLPHGTSLASLLGPTGDIPAAADSALLRYPARWSSSSRAAVAEVPMTADGLTVESISGKGWTILPEAESDWRSHAAAVAQSIKLIKKRLKVQFSHDTRTCSFP